MYPVFKFLNSVHKEFIFILIASTLLFHFNTFSICKGCTGNLSFQCIVYGTATNLGCCLICWILSFFYNIFTVIKPILVLFLYSHIFVIVSISINLLLFEKVILCLALINQFKLPANINCFHLIAALKSNVKLTSASSILILNKCFGLTQVICLLHVLWTQ